jgi:hypothetical protein
LIMPFWFLHHLWKKACSRAQPTDQGKPKPYRSTKENPHCTVAVKR